MDDFVWKVKIVDPKLYAILEKNEWWAITLVISYILFVMVILFVIIYLLPNESRVPIHSWSRKFIYALAKNI